MASQHGSEPRISTEYTFRGIDTAFLENAHLRVEVLTGKGGDIVEFRDKRTDVDVLWKSDHGWLPPNHSLPADAKTTWNDHYPGGWQLNLPIAGFGYEFEGGAYGLHGETALIPWDAEVRRDDEEAVTLGLEADLVRYPFTVERELTLPADAPRLEIAESVTNHGDTELEYVWQHHIMLGQPLVGPAARLDVPAARGRVEDYGDGYANPILESDAEFEWPHAPSRHGGTVDLQEFPPLEDRSHDVVFATNLDEGWYALTNPELDLGFGLTFPTDPFECVWYLRAFNGYRGAPFFNRNYSVGLEPTTAYPSVDLPDAQRENGTMKTLGPGETIEAEFTARTYDGLESVSSIGLDGAVSGGGR